MTKRLRDPTGQDQGPVAQGLGTVRPGDAGTGKRRAAVEALAKARARAKRVLQHRVVRRFAKTRRKAGYRSRP